MQKMPHGLLSKRTLYLPTWKGSAILAALFSGIGYLICLQLYPFLAMQDDSKDSSRSADFLCVEGWASDKVLAAAVSEFEAGEYRKIAIIGGPTGSRERLLGFHTYAALGKKLLIDLGVAPDQIFVVNPHFAAAQRRTFHDISSFKHQLDQLGINPCSLMVFSSDVHARRSTQTYRKVFGKGVKVIGYGSTPEDYDPAKWWQTSSGLKTVIMETISWTYETISPADSGDLIVNPSREIATMCQSESSLH